MKEAAERFLSLEVPGESVSAILLMPREPIALLVLAHGAGAGMRHPFMEGIATGLQDRSVATLRYQFPYMEAGRRAPDRASRLMATVRGAVVEASRIAPGVPLMAGGKSMGGRMTSAAASEAPLLGVRGIVFFGFPLHPPGRPSTERGAHLDSVGLPMLFLQGSRDKLAHLDLLERTLRTVRPVPVLHVIEGADHGFHVPKRSEREDGEVLGELGDVTAEWMVRLAQ